jgi:hypothetical protein
MGNACETLSGNLEGKTALETHTHRWDDNVNSVSIVSDYGLYYREIGVQSPAESREFVL